MSGRKYAQVSVGSIVALIALFASVSCADETEVDPRPRTTLRLPMPDAPDEAADDHPLRPVIQLATDTYRRMRSDVRDYTCVLIRRERVDGRLRSPEFMYAKVRHQQVRDGKIVVPFSVYLKFLKPSAVKGREVLYVEGHNEGKMFARRGGTRFEFVTTRLLPESDLAMSGNRYPITEIGMQKLLYRLIQNARQDLQTHCQVEYVNDASINDRPATAIVVTHQTPQENPVYYQARIFVDKQLGLPVHFEAYGWPETPGGEPELVEQYTYTRLELNQGLNDADFSPDNPQYHVK